MALAKAEVFQNEATRFVEGCDGRIQNADRHMLLYMGRKGGKVFPPTSPQYDGKESFLQTVQKPAQFSTQSFIVCRILMI